MKAGTFIFFFFSPTAQLSPHPISSSPYHPMDRRFVPNELLSQFEPTTFLFVTSVFIRL